MTAPEPPPSAVARHELARFARAAPTMVPVLAVIATVAARLDGLPGWAWNLVVVPVLVLPPAVAGLAAEILLVPRVRRRLRRLSAVPVMASVRVMATVGTLVLLLLVAGPPLARAGILWGWVPLVIPVVVTVVGLVAATGLALYDVLHFRLLASFAELERRRALERFLPREAVDRVLAGEDIVASGERRVVTVMFADIRGSTAIADSMVPGEVVAFLNDYVGAMGAAVFAHGGMIDKYLGDGLMAVFGVLPEPSDGALPAARAALEIRARVALLNRDRAQAALSPVACGVGLHTGEVVLGAIGTEVRSDYTAVGDTVNTASRIESLTKGSEVDGVAILLSEATAMRLRADDFDLRPRGETAIRGKALPITLHSLG